MLSYLPILGVYRTFKHGMFRVGGSCKLRILCAPFISYRLILEIQCHDETILQSTIINNNTFILHSNIQDDQSLVTYIFTMSKISLVSVLHMHLMIYPDLSRLYQLCRIKFIKLLKGFSSFYLLGFGTMFKQ